MQPRGLAGRGGALHWWRQAQSAQDGTAGGNRGAGIAQEIFRGQRGGAVPSAPHHRKPGEHQESFWANDAREEVCYRKIRCYPMATLTDRYSYNVKGHVRRAPIARISAHTGEGVMLLRAEAAAQSCAVSMVSMAQQGTVHANQWAKHIAAHCCKPLHGITDTIFLSVPWLTLKGMVRRAAIPPYHCGVRHWAAAHVLCFVGALGGAWGVLKHVAAQRARLRSQHFAPDWAVSWPPSVV